jgi:hypothetical protein
MMSKRPYRLDSLQELAATAIRRCAGTGRAPGAGSNTVKRILFSGDSV